MAASRRLLDNEPVSDSLANVEKPAGQVPREPRPTEGGIREEPPLLISFNTLSLASGIGAI
jgi:hypothetical protein